MKACGRAMLQYLHNGFVDSQLLRRMLLCKIRKADKTVVAYDANTQVEGGNDALVNDFAEWERQAQEARAALEQAKAQAIEDARERAAREEAGRAIFSKMDRDGSGSLDAKELKVLLTGLGRKATKKQVKNAQAEMDLNGDGDISVDEFITWWCRLDEDQRMLIVEAQAEASSKSKSKSKSKGKTFDADGAAVMSDSGSKTGTSKTTSSRKKPKKKKRTAK